MSDKVIRYIDDTCIKVREFLMAVEALREKKNEWGSLDYGTVLTQDDFTGRDVTKTHLASAMTSIASPHTFLQEGHYTNLYRAGR